MKSQEAVFAMTWMTPDAQLRRSHVEGFYDPFWEARSKSQPLKATGHTGSPWGELFKGVMGMLRCSSPRVMRSGRGMGEEELSSI